VPVALRAFSAFCGSLDRGRFGSDSTAPATSNRRGLVYVFMVKLIVECRIAACAVRGATPPLLKSVPKAPTLPGAKNIGNSGGPGTQELVAIEAAWGQLPELVLAGILTRIQTAAGAETLSTSWDPIGASRYDHRFVWIIGTRRETIGTVGSTRRYGISNRA
jgi:hypothetical protein